jgi:hypothetical protein
MQERDRVHSSTQRTKAETYRELARQAIDKAKATKDEPTKQSLLDTASTWLDMARRAEQFERGDE